MLGEIGDFSKNVNLTILYLYQNNFTGNVNLEVHASESKLTCVCFVGTIPDFSKNVNLKELDISENQCTGNVNLDFHTSESKLDPFIFR